MPTHNASCPRRTEKNQSGRRTVAVVGKESTPRKPAGAPTGYVVGKSTGTPVRGTVARFGTRTFGLANSGAVAGDRDRLVWRCRKDEKKNGSKHKRTRVSRDGTSGARVHDLTTVVDLAENRLRPARIKPQIKNAKRRAITPPADARR